MLTLALTETQAYAQSWLNDGDKVPRWYLDDWEWDELNASMELQFEGDFVYAAAPAPRFEPLKCEQQASQLGDWHFEVSRDHMFQDGRLQR